MWWHCVRDGIQGGQSALEAHEWLQFARDLVASGGNPCPPSETFPEITEEMVAELKSRSLSAFAMCVVDPVAELWYFAMTVHQRAALTSFLSSLPHSIVLHTLLSSLKGSTPRSPHSDALCELLAQFTVSGRVVRVLEAVFDNALSHTQHPDPLSQTCTPSVFEDISGIVSSNDRDVNAALAVPDLVATRLTEATSLRSLRHHEYHMHLADVIAAVVLDRKPSSPGTIHTLERPALCSRDLALAGALLPYVIRVEGAATFLWQTLSPSLASDAPRGRMAMCVALTRSIHLGSVLAWMVRCGEGHTHAYRVAQLIASVCRLRTQAQSALVKTQLLSRHSLPANLIICTAITMLHGSGDMDAREVLGEVASVWQMASALENTPPQQQLAMTQTVLILLGVVCLSSSQPAPLLPPDLTGALFRGVHTHLSAASIAARVQGMVVAEAVGPLVAVGDSKLQFDWGGVLAETRDSLNLACTPLSEPTTAEPEHIPPLSPSPHTTATASQLEGQCEIDPMAPVWDIADGIVTEAVGGAGARGWDEDSLSSISSFEGEEAAEDPQVAEMDLERRKELRAAKPSLRHLTVCLEWLRDTEKRHRFEAALRAIEGAILRGGPAVMELCEAVVPALLHLRDDMCIEGFGQLRNDALVSLVVVCGPRAVRCLAQYFYTRGLGVAERAIVLTVLSAAAERLANPQGSPSSALTDSSLPAAPSKVSTLETSQPQARAIEGPGKWRFPPEVQARIDAKTLTKRSTVSSIRNNVQATINRFAPMLAEFVNPILYRIDHSDLQPVVFGEDPYLLCQVLITLGNLIETAGPSAQDTESIRSVLVFACGVARSRSESQVLKSALWCFVAALSVHSLKFLAHPGLAQQWMAWLSDLERHQDPEVADAAKALGRMPGVLW